MTQERRGAGRRPVAKRSPTEKRSPSEKRSPTEKRSPPPGKFQRRPGPERRGPAERASPDEESGIAGQRRPLAHVGGRIENLSGPEELTGLIRRALSVHPERGVRDHVHGFHSYPARLHPATAARLIEGLSAPQGQVADAFCGSGTVLVEARRLGRRALGLDLNPLAVRLTRFKSNPLPEAERQRLLEAALRVVEHAEERRSKAVGPTRRYSEDERSEFDIHVLLELDGLADGIRKEPPGSIRQALLLALSSIFSKVARQPTADAPNKRLASGFTLHFFAARVGELARQLAAYEKLLPPGVPKADCKEGDARQLDRLGWRNVDLFVSSPPYPGVLDYADYHRTRLRWLRLDAAQLEEQELGARRRLQRLEYREAAKRWEDDFSQVLVAMKRALAPQGHIALIIADSLLAGEPYPADEVVERCGQRAGLLVAARGSQERPHFHAESAQAFGRQRRYEHLLLLRQR